MSGQRSKFVGILAGTAICSMLLSACSTNPGYVTPETRRVSIDRAAPVPPGVLRYCWEEPMVQFQPKGPGIDSDGIYYHPAYVAVREVKQGRWRPCRQMLSEVNGETKNER
jgi:hypothetical protein